MKFGEIVKVALVKASCPSRGTWIEILFMLIAPGKMLKSCPSRGTWIEIREAPRRNLRGAVVPLAGHVD